MTIIWDLLPTSQVVEVNQGHRGAYRKRTWRILFLWKSQPHEPRCSVSPTLKSNQPDFTNGGIKYERSEGVYSAVEYKKTNLHNWEPVCEGGRERKSKGEWVIRLWYAATIPYVNLLVKAFKVYTADESVDVPMSQCWLQVLSVFT